MSWFKTFTIPPEINLDENIVLFYVHNNTASKSTVYSLYIPKKFFYNGTEDYWFYSSYQAIPGRYGYDSNAGDNIIFLQSEEYNYFVIRYEFQYSTISDYDIRYKIIA